MAKDVAYLGEPATAMKYVPVIDKQYTLEQADVETGRERAEP